MRGNVLAEVSVSGPLYDQGGQVDDGPWVSDPLALEGGLRICLSDGMQATLGKPPLQSCILE